MEEELQKAANAGSSSSSQVFCRRVCIILCVLPAPSSALTGLGFVRSEGLQLALMVIKAEEKH